MRKVDYAPHLLVVLILCLLLLWLLVPAQSAALPALAPAEMDHFIYVPLVKPSIPAEFIVQFDSLGFEAIPLPGGGVLLHEDDGVAVKVDQEMRPRWAVDIAGESPTRFAAVTADGHIYTAGSLLVNYDRELTVLKFSPKGKVLWQRSLDTEYHDGDYPFGIAPAMDGGIVGASRIMVEGFFDGWLFKLNADGTLAWQKAIGGDGGQLFSAIAPLPDGGSIAVGSHYRKDNPSGMWLVKFDPAGSAIWQKVFAGTECMANTIRVTSQGDFIIAGNGYYGCLIRVGSNGELVWSRVYEHPEGEIRDVQPVEGGGYLVAGRAAAGQGWAALIDADGDIVWQRLYASELYSVVRSGPGDFLLSWVGGLMKIAADGSIANCDRVLGPGQATAVGKQASSTSVSLPSSAAGAVFTSYEPTPAAFQPTSTWLCPQSSADPCQ